MSDKYSIQPVTDFNAWDELVERSPQGTIFLKGSYLTHLGIDFELWYVKKGNSIRAGFLVMTDESKEKLRLNDLVIYSGIFFIPDLQIQKPAKIYSEQFEITEFVVEYLTKRFKKIELALTPQFSDIRPFLWLNYNLEDKTKKFQVSIRYTSYLDISELNNDLPEEEFEIFKKLDVIRQRNIRKARKEGGYVKEESRTNEFLEYYRGLMESQGSFISEEKLRSMESLLTGLLGSKQARMFVSYNASHKVGTINTYCFDSKRAYYLFGASNPDNREEYCGTIVFWDGFKALAKQNIAVMDMEGINSPKRGWFKLSFGGDIRPYYEVSYGIE